MNTRDYIDELITTKFMPTIRPKVLEEVGLTEVDPYIQHMYIKPSKMGLIVAERKSGALFEVMIDSTTDTILSVVLIPF